MSASREPHDAYLLSFPLTLMLAHEAHRLMHILKRYILHSGRQTIREYRQGYSLLIEPLRQIMSLCSMPYIPIAASGATEDGFAARLLRQIDGKRRVGHSPRMDAIRLIRLLIGPREERRRGWGWLLFAPEVKEQWSCHGWSRTLDDAKEKNDNVNLNLNLNATAVSAIVITYIGFFHSFSSLMGVSMRLKRF